MPPKQKRGRNEGIDSDHLTYWETAIRSIELTPAGAAFDSFDKDIILDAHHWGEAMVLAHMECLEDCQNATAKQRLSMLRSHAKAWYKCGYSYYLSPKTKGAPTSIARHAHFEHNPRLFRGSLVSLDTHADKAADRWREQHARPFFCAAEIAAQKEANAPAVAAIVAPQVKRHAPAVPRRAIAALTSSPTVTTPTTVVIAQATGPRLPKQLRCLLDTPKTADCSTPRAHLVEMVRAGLRSERIMRVWDDGEGTDASSSNKLHFSFLSKRAHLLQRVLEARDLDAVFGGGSFDPDVDKASMGRVGLQQLGKGSFNAIWFVREAQPWLAEVLPSAVVAPFSKGTLVLRSPISSADWLTESQAIDEAANMLFTALVGCGPRIGALSFARCLVEDHSSLEEGAKVMRYKVFAFMERATYSVDQRYSTGIGADASAVSNRAYLDSLIHAIYQVSNQGYVHLDGTLRNFVDTFPHKLPGHFEHFGVKVIDVDSKCFRRMYSTGTTEWRYLFLFNLLMVLVFLKFRLGARWNTDVHWARVRDTCKQLISELPKTCNLASTLLWHGEFCPSMYSDKLTDEKYAGNSLPATRNAALQQLRHYLLQQPLNEATNNYINVALRPDASKAPPTVDEVRFAKNWFEREYRGRLAPYRTFFHKKFVNRSAPQRFVEVAYEFLDTEHATLVKTYGTCTPPVHVHKPTSEPEFVWGIFF